MRRGAGDHLLRRDRIGSVAWIVALLCGPIYGCEASDEAVETGVEVRDSLGVEIVTTPGASARAPNGWTVDPQPELVIGREGEPDYEFDNIGGLRRLPGGGVLVVDGGSAELRFYDRQGTFVGRSGGRGDGPGEFQVPALVPRLGGDSILVFDPPLNRFTL